MGTKANQEHVTIKLNSEERKQKLPLNLILTFAAGTIAGMVLILGLFWGVEKIIGL